MVALRAPLLLLMMLLSGCSGGSTGSDEGEGHGAAAGDDAGHDAGTDPAQGAEGAAGEDEAEPAEVAWDGTTGTYYCAPTGPNSCAGEIVESGESLYPLAGARYTNSSVDLTLTWDSGGNPLLEELEFDAWSYTSCGTNCYQGAGGFVSVQGTSPLTLSGVLSGGGTGIVLTVDVARATPDPVYAKASVETPFHVEGTVTPL